MIVEIPERERPGSAGAEDAQLSSRGIDARTHRAHDARGLGEPIGLLQPYVRRPSKMAPAAWDSCGKNSHERVQVRRVR